MLYEALVALVGEVPEGFEPLVYVCRCFGFDLAVVLCFFYSLVVAFMDRGEVICFLIFL